MTVSSPDAAPGGFGEITFRVPSESDTATTTSLRVQLPTDTPFAFVSVKPVPGWTATTTTTPLPKNADSLTFPALQGYDDGSTVSWVDPTIEGQAEPEHPAPTLRLAAASGDTADV